MALWIKKEETTKKSKERKISNSFQQFAKRKLEKHPYYKGRGENERDLLAHQLTDADKILHKFFRKIFSEPAVANIKSKMDEEDKTELQSESEVRAAEERSKYRIEEVAKFEVKLLLRHIDCHHSKLTRKAARLLKMWYGPLHSALLINNRIVVEWNANSLVIPEDYRPGDMRYPLVTSVLRNEHSVDEPADVRGEEVDLIFNASAQKLELLNNLISIISKYNSKCTYNAAFRNCQHFVIEALEKMGCKNIPTFEGRMAEYYQRLEAGTERIDFEHSHAKLDEYVTENVLDISDEKRQAISAQHNEYLLCQYIEFHVEELTNSPDPDQWECSQGVDCKMPDLVCCMDDDLRSEHLYLKPKTLN